ncbi:hypothetical protein BLOT_004647 [Blomia tropicalis]|nr:hypothetical protein BLOT_004647 [Blomia tropicalis]
MDRLSDNVRSMFDLIGNNLGQLIPTDGRNKQKSKQKVNRNQPKSGLSRKRSGLNQTSKSDKSKSLTHQLKGVFAPRLLHSASLTANSERWLDLKSMVAHGYHCAAYLIHCVQHDRIAVTRPSKSQALWMPYLPAPSHLSWQEAGLAGLLIILSNANMDLFVSLKNCPPFNTQHLVEVLDVQMPNTMTIITRLIWYIRLDKTNQKRNTDFRCCQDNESIIWLDEREISSQGSALDYLWGRKLIEMHRVVTTSYQQGIIPACSYEELVLTDVFQYMPRSPPNNQEEQLLSSTKLTEKDVERLYSDYLDNCFPSTTMTLHSFKVYMTRYGLNYNDERLEHFFRSFNFNATGYVTFSELLLGLACLDCKSIHNQTRAKFVLRYYDVRRKGYLNETDIRIMFQDMLVIEKQNDFTIEDIDNRVKQVLQTVNHVKDEASGELRISERSFLTAIGEHKFRGTSQLCRISRSILAVILNAILVDSNRKTNKISSKCYANLIENYGGTCVGCKSKRPIIDENLSLINTEGYVSIIKSNKLVETNLKVNSNIDNDSKKKVGKTKSKIRSNSIKSDNSNNNNKKKSKLRVESFDQLSLKDVEIQKFSSMMSLIELDEPSPQEMEAMEVARQLLDMIREFSIRKGDTSRPNGFMSETVSESASLCDKLDLLVRVITSQLRESRLVAVQSPAFVIGDIHGNLSDLLSMEKTLWSRYPLMGPNLVFLGDMVDRGRWSVECVTYLLSLKVLMPKKVNILRGNHEVRELQCRYTYRNECIQKYGDHYGERLWQLTNQLFDQLPLCAVIDEAVWCAHGGIPKSTDSLAEIANLPEVMSEPETESSIAWEILWSDPLNQDCFVEMARLLHIDMNNCTEGFLPNQKRGTAWAFNEVAVDHFLAANRLSHVIRAHEVPASGFFFHFRKKCATIFSCSHYCGNNNECAVMLLDRNVIRVIRVDTSQNLSATD